MGSRVKGAAAFLALATALLWSASAVAQSDKQGKAHIGLPQDWSQRHILYTDHAAQNTIAERPNPRAIMARLARARAREEFRQQIARGNRFRPAPKKKAHIDWSVDLGAPMAPDTFPAKYSFNISAAPDCTKDYIAYGLNTAGSGTKANLVGLNNLYSGSTPATGICGSGAATVNWAYQVPGAIKTSTVLSMDGTKVAFLESGTPAIFHVLAWKAEGTLTAPVGPPTAANAPAAGSGEMASVALHSPAQSFCPDSPTSLSSPFIDYDNDVAYVGADNGCLYRIKNVFCSTASCISSPEAPSLDLPFGNGSGAYLLPAAPGAMVLGSPVLDSVTGNIFVGSSTGQVWGLNTVKAVTDVGNAPVSGSGQSFGTGNPITDIVVDSSNSSVFVYSENGSAVSLPGAQLLQFQTSTLLSPANAAIGSGSALSGKGPVYGVAFNDAFFTSNDQATWWAYMCIVSDLGAPDYPVLYRVGFDGAGKINAASNPTVLNLNGTSTADTCAGPMTEIMGNDGKDRLFFSLAGAALVNYVDITNTPVLGPASAVTTTGGTTGIVVDNVSTANQASSIYYMQLGGTNAVKLTQSGLQ